MKQHVWVELLRAQIRAWPIVSEAAFRHATAGLAPATPGLWSQGTTALWDELCDWMRPRAIGTSMTELCQIRDKYWTSADLRSPQSITDYALRLAADCLEDRGSVLTPRALWPLPTGVNSGPPPLPPDSLQPWRLLTWLMPEDLLVAAIGAQKSDDRAIGHVSPLPLQVGRMLSEHPVAETHLHLGAAMDFGLLWTSLTLPVMLQHLVASAQPAVTRKWTDAPFGSGPLFVRRLLGARCLRLVMAAFLKGRTSSACTHVGHSCRCWENFLRQDVDGELLKLRNGLNLVRTLRTLARDWSLGYGPAVNLPLAVSASSFSLLERALRTLLLPASPKAPKGASKLATLFINDPLHSWFGSAAPDVTPEHDFTVSALRYAQHHREFALAFWQYERVRCAVFRYVTQEPGTAGLDWFRKHYERIGRLDQGVAPALNESALRLQSREIALRALEVRVRPKDKFAGVAEQVRSLAAAARRHAGQGPSCTGIEIGLILHLVKDPTYEDAKGQTWINGAPHRTHGPRYWRWYSDARKRVRAVRTALQRRPERLVLLRGIDIANAELAVPTWTVAPLLLYLRQASTDAAAALRRQQPLWQVPPMRVCCHAGEDYRILFEGLRRIHELLEVGLLQPSDRLGHAVALGDDPTLHLRGHFFQPAEERLEDLLWLLDLAAMGVSLPASYLPRLQDEAAHWTRRIWDSTVTLETVRDRRRLLLQPNWVEGRGYGILPGVIQLQRPAFVHRYLTDADAFRRGQESVEIVLFEPDVAALHTIQIWLRGRLSQRSITVESNPSSNQLIAALPTLSQHPAFRLQPPPNATAQAAPPVQLSINSDDPLCFATCLRDEYAYIYDALLAQGLSATEAIHWLDQRRQDGWRSRFTVPQSAAPDILKRLCR